MEDLVAKVEVEDRVANIRLPTDKVLISMKLFQGGLPSILNIHNLQVPLESICMHFLEKRNGFLPYGRIEVVENIDPDNPEIYEYEAYFVGY